MVIRSHDPISPCREHRPLPVSHLSLTDRGPSVAAAAVLTFASAVRDISTVVLLAGFDTQPLSLLMLEYGFEGRLESAAALGLLITMIMGVVTLIARHFSKSSIRRGAAKDPVAADSQRTARISTTAE